MNNYNNNIVKLSKIDLCENLPEILLFGNGLSIQAGGKSTNRLLEDLWQNDIFGLNKAIDEKVHFPYQIIIGTEDHVDIACNKISEHMTSMDFYNGKDFEIYNKYLSLKMDAFLTTNYSYEAEVALDTNFPKRYSKYAVHTDKVNKRESKYFLHSFYRFEKDGQNKDFWHIHGEAKNKSSIVIGQYYYGRLLHKEIEYIDSYSKTQYSDQMQTINPKSWIDYFLIGNVYIVGLGLSMAEYDLWWLLNRKKRDKNNKGLVYYFCNKKDSISAAELELLRLYQVNVIRDDRDVDADSDDYYSGYYEWVYQQILRKVDTDL